MRNCPTSVGSTELRVGWFKDTVRLDHDSSSAYLGPEKEENGLSEYDMVVGGRKNDNVCERSLWKLWACGEINPDGTR